MWDPRLLIRKRYVLLAAVIGLVGLSDGLVYAVAHHGVNLAILASALLVLLLVRYPTLLQAGPGRIGLALTFGIILSLVEAPGRIGLLFCGFALVSLSLIGRLGWRRELSIYFSRWVRWLLHCGVSLPHDLILWHRWEKRRRSRSGGGLLVHWLVPIGIAMIFLVLFRLANPLMELVIRHFLDLLWNIRLPSPARIAFWLIVLLLGWGLLRIRQRREAGPRSIPPPIPGGRAGMDAGLTVRSLLLCNAIFLVQNLLDSSFLWYGLALPEGMRYAQYAHRGAYPLLASALLAAAFVLIAFRPNGPAHHSRPARWLVYLWLGQNVFLTLSALWRLQVYVEAYSLTRLRVAAAIWMGLVAVGLVLIIWRIRSRQSNAWLLRMNVSALLLVLYACAFVNFDGAIADFNVNARLAGKTLVEIDLAYLEVLGPEALPALDRLTNELPAMDSELAAKAVAVKIPLREQLNTQMENWRGWSWRRHRIQHSVADK